MLSSVGADGIAVGTHAVYGATNPAPTAFHWVRPVHRQAATKAGSAKSLACPAASNGAAGASASLAAGFSLGESAQLPSCVTALALPPASGTRCCHTSCPQPFGGSRKVAKAACVAGRGCGSSSGVRRDGAGPRAGAACSLAKGTPATVATAAAAAAATAAGAVTASAVVAVAAPPPQTKAPARRSAALNDQQQAELDDRDPDLELRPTTLDPQESPSTSYAASTCRRISGSRGSGARGKGRNRNRPGLRKRQPAAESGAGAGVAAARELDPPEVSALPFGNNFASARLYDSTAVVGTARCEATAPVAEERPKRSDAAGLLPAADAAAAVTTGLDKLVMGGPALTAAIVACNSWQDLAELLYTCQAALNPTHVAAALVVLARLHRGPRARDGEKGRGRRRQGAGGEAAAGWDSMDPGALLVLGSELDLDLDPADDRDSGAASRGAPAAGDAARPAVGPTTDRSGENGAKAWADKRSIASGGKSVAGKPCSSSSNRNSSSSSTHTAADRRTESGSSSSGNSAGSLESTVAASGRKGAVADAVRLRASAAYGSLGDLAADVWELARVRHLPYMSAREVSNVTWALAQLAPAAAAAATSTAAATSPGTSPFAAATAAASLQAACHARWGAFNGQELTILLHGLVQLDRDILPYDVRRRDSWLACWFAASEPHMWSVGPRGLTMVLWALVQVWRRHQPQPGFPPSAAADMTPPLPYSWTLRLRARLASQLPHLHASPLVQVAWGLARLQPWLLTTSGDDGIGGDGSDQAAVAAEGSAAVGPDPGAGATAIAGGSSLEGRQGPAPGDSRESDVAAGPVGSSVAAGAAESLLEALLRYSIRRVPYIRTLRDLSQLSWAVARLHLALKAGGDTAAGAAVTTGPSAVQQGLLGQQAQHPHPPTGAVATAPAAAPAAVAMAPKPSVRGGEALPQHPAPPLPASRVLGSGRKDAVETQRLGLGFGHHMVVEEAEEEEEQLKEDGWGGIPNSASPPGQRPAPVSLLERPARPMGPAGASAVSDPPSDAARSPLPGPVYHQYQQGQHLHHDLPPITNPVIAVLQPPVVYDSGDATGAASGEHGSEPESAEWVLQQQQLGHPPRPAARLAAWGPGVGAGPPTVLHSLTSVHSSFLPSAHQHDRQPLRPLQPFLQHRPGPQLPYQGPAPQPPMMAQAKAQSYPEIVTREQQGHQQQQGFGGVGGPWLGYAGHRQREGAELGREGGAPWHGGAPTTAGSRLPYSSPPHPGHQGQHPDACLPQRASTGCIPSPLQLQRRLSHQQQELLQKQGALELSLRRQQHQQQLRRQRRQQSPPPAEAQQDPQLQRLAQLGRSVVQRWQELCANVGGSDDGGDGGEGGSRTRVAMRSENGAEMRPPRALTQGPVPSPTVRQQQQPLPSCRQRPRQQQPQQLPGQGPADHRGLRQLSGHQALHLEQRLSRQQGSLAQPEAGLVAASQAAAPAGSSHWGVEALNGTEGSHSGRPLEASGPAATVLSSAAVPLSMPLRQQQRQHQMEPPGQAPEQQQQQQQGSRLPTRATATDVAVASWAFVRLGWRPPPELCRSWVRLAMRRPGDFSAQGLTNVLHLASTVRELRSALPRLAAVALRVGRRRRLAAADVTAAGLGDADSTTPLSPLSASGAATADAAAGSGALYGNSTAMNSARTLMALAKARLSCKVRCWPKAGSVPRGTGRRRGLSSVRVRGPYALDPTGRRVRQGRRDVAAGRWGADLGEGDGGVLDEAGLKAPETSTRTLGAASPSLHEKVVQGDWDVEAGNVSRDGRSGRGVSGAAAAGRRHQGRRDGTELRGNGHDHDGAQSGDRTAVGASDRRSEPTGTPVVGVALSAWYGVVHSLARPYGGQAGGDPRQHASAEAVAPCTAEDLIIAVTAAARLGVRPSRQQLALVHAALLRNPGYPGSSPSAGRTSAAARSNDDADEAGGTLPGVPDAKLLPLAVSLARLQQRAGGAGRSGGGRGNSGIGGRCDGGSSRADVRGVGRVAVRRNPMPRATAASTPTAGAAQAAAGALARMGGGAEVEDEATVELVHALVVRCTALMRRQRLPLRALASMGWSIGVLLTLAASEPAVSAVVATATLAAGAAPAASMATAQQHAVQQWRAEWARSMSTYDVALAPVSELCAVLSTWAALGWPVDSRTQARVLSCLTPELASLPSRRLAALDTSLESLAWRLTPAWAQWLAECRAAAGAEDRAAVSTVRASGAAAGDTRHVARAEPLSRSAGSSAWPRRAPDGSEPTGDGGGGATPGTWLSAGAAGGAAAGEGAAAVGPGEGGQRSSPAAASLGPVPVHVPRGPAGRPSSQVRTARPRAP